VTEAGIRDQVRQVLMPMWNAWYFFTLYANTEGYAATYRTDAPIAGANTPNRAIAIELLPDGFTP